ncbi:MAG: hypothetical protein DI543_17660, partial [Bradyrhizobium icense]
MPRQRALQLVHVGAVLRGAALLRGLLLQGMLALLQQGTPAAQVFAQLGIGGMLLLVALQLLHGRLQGLQLLPGGAGFGL